MLKKVLLITTAACALLIAAYVGVRVFMFWQEPRESAQELFAKAERMKEAGNFELAQKFYTGAIKAEPDAGLKARAYLALVELANVEKLDNVREFPGQLRKVTRLHKDAVASGADLDVCRDSLKTIDEYAEAARIKHGWEQVHGLAEKVIEKYPEAVFARFYRAKAALEHQDGPQGKLFEPEAVRADLEAAAAVPELGTEPTRYLARWHLWMARRTGIAEQKGREHLKKARQLRKKCAADFTEQPAAGVSAVMLLLAEVEVADAGLSLTPENLAFIQQVVDYFTESPHPEHSLQLARALYQVDSLLREDATADETAYAGKARQVIKLLHDKNPRHRQTALLWARLCMAAEEYDTAYDVINQALSEQAPAMTIKSIAGWMDRIELLRLKCTAAFSLHRMSQNPVAREKLIEDARQTVEEIVDVAPQTPFAYLNQGALAFAEGKYREAVTNLKLLADNPGLPLHSNAALMSGISLSHLEEYGAAAKMFEAVAEDPGASPRNQLKAYAELTDIALQRRDLTKADRYVKNIAELAPHDPRTKLLQAKVDASRMFIEQVPEDERSGTADTIIAELTPLAEDGDTTAMRLISILSLATDDLEKAQKWGRKWLDQEPLSIAAWANWLNTTRHEEDYAVEAKRRLTTACRDLPDTHPARKMLQKTDVSQEIDPQNFLDIVRLAMAANPLRQKVTLVKTYWKRGQSDKAEEVLTEVQDEFPDAIEAKELRFRAALRDDNHEDAEKFLAALKSTDYPDWMFIFRKAELQMARGEYADAVDALKTLLQSHEKLSSAWHLRARAEVQRGKLLKAEWCYEQALEIKGDSVPLLVGYFEVLDARGKHTDALTALKDAVTAAPSDWRLFHKYVDYEEMHGDPRAAFNLRLWTARNQPDYMENKRRLALLALNFGRQEKARALLDELKNKYPDRFEILAAEARYQEAIGKFQAGDDLLRKRIANLGDNADVKHWIALARYRRRHDPAGAAEAYLTGIQLDKAPDMTVLREALSYLQSSGMNEEVVKLCESVDKNTVLRSRTLRNGYIGALTVLGRLAEARKVVDELGDKAADDAGLALLRAGIALREGNKTEARQAVDAAVAANEGESPRPLTVRARMYLQDSQEDWPPEKIEKDIREALEIDPDYSPAREVLVELFRRTGRNDKAEQQLRTLIETRPTHISYRRQLLQLLIRTGQLETAADFLKACETEMPQAGLWSNFRSQLHQARQEGVKALLAAARAYKKEQTAEALARYLQLLIEAGRFQAALEVVKNASPEITDEPLIKALQLRATVETGDKTAMDMTPVFRTLLETTLAKYPTQLSAVAGQMPKNILSSEWKPLLEKKLNAENTASPALVTVLAGIYLQDGEAEKACAILQKGDNDDTLSWQTRYHLTGMLATAARQAEKYKLAQSTYEKLITMNPDEGAVRLQLAELLLDNLDDSDAAEKQAEKALELAASNAVKAAAEVVIGRAQLEKNYLSSARSVLHSSLDRKESWEAHFYLSRAYEPTNENEQSEEAEEYLRKAHAMAADANNINGLMQLLDYAQEHGREELSQELQLSAIRAGLARNDLNLVQKLLQAYPDKEDRRYAEVKAMYAYRTDGWKSAAEVLDQLIASRGAQAAVEDYQTKTRVLLACEAPPEAVIKAFEQACEAEAKDQMDASKSYAEWLYRQGRYEQARQLYLKVYTGSGEVSAWAAALRITLNQDGAEQVMPELEDALRKHPNNGEMWLLKARALTALDRAGEAHTAANRAVRVMGDDPRPYIIRARIALKNGSNTDLVAVKTDLEQALESPEGEAQAQALMADYYLRQYEVDKAGEQLRSLVDKYPTNVRYRERLIEFYMFQQQLEKAQDIAEESLLLQPGIPVWHRQLARIHYRRGQKEKSLEHGRLYWQKSNTTEALSAYLSVLIAADNAAEVEKTAAEASPQQRNHPGILAVRGRAKWITDEQQKSFDLFRQAIQQAETENDLEMIAGQAASVFDMAAVHRLVASIDLSNNKTFLEPLLWQVGTASPHPGKTLEQLREIKPLISEHSRELKVAVLQVEAALYHKQGQYDKAEKIYREALKLRPESAHILNNLADVLIENLGRPEEGMLLAKKSLDYAPAKSLLKAYAHATLGQARIKMGMLEQAHDNFMESLKIREIPGCWYYLGKLYQAQNESAKADSAFARARKLAQMLNDEFTLSKVMAP